MHLFSGFLDNYYPDHFFSLALLQQESISTHHLCGETKLSPSQLEYPSFRPKKIKPAHSDLAFGWTLVRFLRNTSTPVKTHLVQSLCFFYNTKQLYAVTNGIFDPTILGAKLTPFDSPFLKATGVSTAFQHNNNSPSQPPNSHQTASLNRTLIPPSRLGIGTRHLTPNQSKLAANARHPCLPVSF